MGEVPDTPAKRGIRMDWTLEFSCVKRKHRILQEHSQPSVERSGPSGQLCDYTQGAAAEAEGAAHLQESREAAEPAVGTSPSPPRLGTSSLKI